MDFVVLAAWISFAIVVLMGVALLEIFCGIYLRIDQLFKMKEIFKEFASHLQSENAELRQAKQCNACKRESKDTVCLPCAHLSTCETCCMNSTYCMVCSAEVQDRLRVYVV